MYADAAQRDGCAVKHPKPQGYAHTPPRALDHMLAIGESVLVHGSAKEPYLVSHVASDTGSHYLCTCLAWKYMKAPIKKKRCKHIDKILQQESSSVSNDSSVTSPITKKNREEDRSTENTTEEHAKKRKLKTDSDPSLSIDVALAEQWTKTKDPTGYFMSEKLDGMRCIWDGQNLYSRAGNAISAPAQLIRQLPPGTALDGELFLGRSKFHALMSIVKRKVTNEDDWKGVRYMVFDAPLVHGPFQTRLNEIQKNLPAHSEWVCAVDQTRCQNSNHLQLELDRILAMGGEGVMLRRPDAPYIGKRTSDLLKVKKTFDEEAWVIGCEFGTGRNQGRMGALKCIDEHGITFKIGTGFPDSMRDHPPDNGTKITYSYQEKFSSGKPRFPVFMRIHEQV